ncbi:MAG TPA: glycosyltransferase family 39 protein [Candidatus Eremiobacteraceae bacterium]|nr:glycosyltransferase family 39 protein [Candidatus Eremiobacteraceae bacterium]
MKRLDPGNVMLAIALLLGAATRLVGLTSGSVYVDEVHTLRVAGTTLPNMIAQLAANDYHPPLFYAIAHALLGLHLQPEAYRYFTAPLALVTIAATWAIARRLLGSTPAGIAALVIAIDPTAIMWDRIFRMYVVLDALVALSWWLLITAESSSGARRTWLWIAFAVCAIMQPYIHYIGILNVACQTAYGLWRLRTAWPAAASAIASALAFLWWLPYAVRQIPGGGLVAGTAALPVEWWTIARDAVLEGAPLAWIQSPGFDIIVTIIVVAMSIWAALTARRTILLFWLLLAALQIVLSLVSGKFLAAPRYLLPILPVFAMGVGQVVDRHLLLPKVRLAPFAVGGLILALLGYCATNVLFDPLYQFPDWNIVASIFAQHAQPADEIIVDQGYDEEALGSAFGGRRINPVGSNSLESMIEYVHEDREARIWYIENQYYFVDPNRKVLSALESTRPKLGEWLEPRVELSNRVYVVLFGPAWAPVHIRER